MRPIPIRIRVAAAFALAMALVLAGTGWFLYARLDTHLSVSLNRELRTRAADLSTLVKDSRTPASLEAAGGSRFVEHGEAFAQLLDRQGRVLDATRPLGATPLLRGAELRQAAQGSITVNRNSIPGLDEPSRLLTAPVDRGGHRLILVVGLTRQDRVETLASLRDVLLIALPVALLLATAAGYGLAGLSLRPVEAMRRRAAAISAATPGERLPVARTGDEVERLGETLNAMLARLESALDRERDFVADAGHELRTPLSLLRTELELALRHGETREEFREALRVSSEEVDRLAQLADDLLLIASSDRGKLELRIEPLDTAELFDSVVNRFQWRAEETGRSVGHEAKTGLFVRGDRLRLEQALSNVVDNALRHGEGDVKLAAAAVDGVVELHVTDEGGGFPPSFLERAFERFSRSRDRPEGTGTGLGLAIVRAIAEAHLGRAQAANAPGGGADVWLEVPRGDSGR
jgi:two-component system OmpR family sensor kinase